jgi:hypothetical protein
MSSVPAHYNSAADLERPFKRAVFTKTKIAIAKRTCSVQVLGLAKSGRSVAWLARVVRVHEVVSSNLTAPTNFPQ